MKNYKFLRMIFLIFLLPSILTITSCSQPGNGSDVQILKGATIIDGTGSPAIENGVIIIKGEMIECIGTEEDCSINSVENVIDVSGKFITPGLIDAHVHFFQTAFFDSRPDALDLRESYPFMEIVANQKLHPERYYEAYLCSGITGVYDVGGATWSIDFQRTAESNPFAPHVAAAGPLVTPSTLTLFNTPSDKVLVNLDSEETGRKTVDYLSALGSTGIKIWQLRPNNDSFMNYIDAISDEIEKHGNQMIAHATTLDQAKAAMKYGTKLLVHSVSDKPIDDEFVELAKEQGTIYTPTLIVGSGYMLAYRAAAGIAPYTFDDPNRCVDTKTRELLLNASQFRDHPRFTDSFLDRLNAFNPDTDRVSRINLENLSKVYEAGIPIAVGTDAGNPGTLHGPSIYEEMEAMQQAGISPEDLIVMATRNGAMAMRRSEDFGSLEPGKYANLIVLEKNPSKDISHMRSITHTMVKGSLKKISNLAGHD